MCIKVCTLVTSLAFAAKAAFNQHATVSCGYGPIGDLVVHCGRTFDECAHVIIGIIRILPAFRFNWFVDSDQNGFRCDRHMFLINTAIRGHFFCIGSHTMRNNISASISAKLREKYPR